MTRSIGPTSFAFSARSRSAPAAPSKGAATSCGKFFDQHLRCPTGCFARRGGRFDITLCTQAHSRRDGGYPNLTLGRRRRPVNEISLEVAEVRLGSKGEI